MFDLHTISFLLIFIAAGLVKGVTGMGLPTVAMGLLGLLMPPQAAAALLVLPSLLTNLWQLLAGPALAQIVRRLWLMMTGIIIGTLAGSSPADRPQSSVVGAGAWRRIDSLCRVCALQSGVSGFRPRGEVAVAAHGRADRRYHRGDRVRPFPGYRRWAFVATSWCRPWGCRSPFPPWRWRPASPCTMAGMMMHGYCRRWRCCRRCSACGWDSGSARVSARSAFVRAFCCSCWRWG